MVTIAVTPSAALGAKKHTDEISYHALIAKVPVVHAEVKLAGRQETLMEQLLQPRKQGAPSKRIPVGDGTPMCTELQAPSATLPNFSEAVFCADARLGQRLDA